MRIFIIDDEYKTRESLGRLILHLFPDFKIIGEADNGIDGLKQVPQLMPDLVITDIKMPKMDGLSMIEHLHQICPAIHYLVLTGYAEFEYAQKAVRLSVIDYLLKPVNIQQLKEILENIQSKLKQTELPAPSETTISTSSNFVTYVLQDISLHYAQKLYLDDYARHFHITPEYASNLFTKETGQNFSLYLKTYRIEKAKELLTKSDLKIYEIAFRSGYSDAKYFCRAFKEITGLSPSSFLKQQVSS